MLSNLFCRSLYWAISLGKCGLGQTIDILPTRTQNRFGNSSNDVLRINLPTLVTLGSFSILGIIASLVLALDLMSLLYIFSAAAPQKFSPTPRCVYILRNLMKVNNSPYFPTLFCIYSIGPGLSSLMINPMINIKGDSSTIARLDVMISKNLLSTMDRLSSLLALYSSATILPKASDW